MTTATICSVRIPKIDSKYVSITCCYQDDSSRLFYSEGEKYENTIVSRDLFENNKDLYVVGARVRLWYSSSVQHLPEGDRTRWFVNIEPA